MIYEVQQKRPLKGIFTVTNVFEMEDIFYFAEYQLPSVGEENNLHVK